MVLDTVHILLSEIWKEHLISPKLSNFALSENMEGRAEWSSAYASISHTDCIFQIEDWELREWKTTEK